MWKVLSTSIKPKRCKILFWSILDFLQSGVNRGLSVSTLEVQLLALSVFLESKLLEDSLVKHFLLATEHACLIRSKVLPPWDLSLVLQGLSRTLFEPLSTTLMRHLTLKMVFLLAITTARRVGDLQMLSVKDPYLTILPHRVVFRPDPLYLPKVATRFHGLQKNYTAFVL